MNQLIRNMVGYRLIRFQDLKRKIAAVTFFFTVPSQLIFFVKFDPTLSAHNYAPKTPNLKNYHIFGKLWSPESRVWTLAFTWRYPGYVFLYQNLKQFGEKQKKTFFAFFCVTLKIIFKWPPIGHYRRLTPCT